MVVETSDKNCFSYFYVQRNPFLKLTRTEPYPTMTFFEAYISSTAVQNTDVEF